MTNGAASDIQQVTRMAEAMVTQFGMSSDLGNVAYGRQPHGLSRPGRRRRNISGETAVMIDNEIRRIVDDGL